MRAHSSVLKRLFPVLVLVGGFGVGCKQYAAPVTSGVNLRLTIRTGGAENVPDGFLFSLDNKTPYRVPPQADLYFPEMLRSNHTIMLSDLAPGCAVSPSNPYTFDLGLDRPPTRVEITVGCPSPSAPLTAAQN